MSNTIDNLIEIPERPPRKPRKGLLLAPNIRLLTIPEHVFEIVLGCVGGHVWGWPVSTDDMTYPEPFDSHQVCRKCSKTRFYKTKGNEDTPFQAGPLFKKSIDRERVA
jgi:hypothetical protein